MVGAFGDSEAAVFANLGGISGNLSLLRRAVPEAIAEGHRAAREAAIQRA